MIPSPHGLADGVTLQLGRATALGAVHTRRRGEEKSVISGDPGISLGVLAIEPVPLHPRTLSLKPRQIRLRAIAADPYPDIFIRGRAPRDLASLQTIDMDDPHLDAWVRALFDRLSRASRD